MNRDAQFHYSCIESHARGGISRRQWLAGGTSAVIAWGLCRTGGFWSGDAQLERLPLPTFSITPVVGDGQWIWRQPPESERGYLEPRDFELRTTIRWTGTGAARDLVAATVVPTTHGEQEILKSSVAADGLRNEVQALGSTAAHWMVGTGSIAQGQVIEASLTQTLRLHKSYFGYERDQFPAVQEIERKVSQTHLGNSPGIGVRSGTVRELSRSIADPQSHPWDRAYAFFQWTRENIRGQIGAYTSVDEALKNRVGDCEERAGVFIALCRASGIPARLVWIPNHAWAEFYLVDEQQLGRWIPAHTAAYDWFGWTGVHELVLQKGDRIRLPQTGGTVRLIGDWHRWVGAKPKVEFTAELTPLGATADEAGPGARTKQLDGRWTLNARHSADRWMRTT